MSSRSQKKTLALFFLYSENPLLPLNKTPLPLEKWYDFLSLDFEFLIVCLIFSVLISIKKKEKEKKRTHSLHFSSSYSSLNHCGYNSDSSDHIIQDKLVVRVALHYDLDLHLFAFFVKKTLVIAVVLSKDQTSFQKVEYERVGEYGAMKLSMDELEENKDPELLGVVDVLEAKEMVEK